MSKAAATTAMEQVEEDDNDEVASAAGLIRTVEIRLPGAGAAGVNSFSQTYSKEDGQVSSVMNTISSTLLTIYEELYIAIINLGLQQAEAIFLELNTNLNGVVGIVKPFIYFGTKSGQQKGVTGQLESVLYILDSKSSGRAIPVSGDSHFALWCRQNRFYEGRVVLNESQQNVFNSVILFFVNLYKYVLPATSKIKPELLETLKNIIKTNFTIITATCLAKGYSDSAIFLEAATQKFIPKQELTLCLCESSDKIASFLAKYIDGFALNIRKTAKTQDAYIMIMSKNILDFLVKITQGRLMGVELQFLLEALTFIDIHGSPMRAETSDQSMLNSDNIFKVLVSIKELKEEMQQKLLDMQNDENKNPEGILDLSFEQLSEEYMSITIKNWATYRRPDNTLRLSIKLFYDTDSNKTTSISKISAIMLNYYALQDFTEAMKMEYERPKDQPAAAESSAESSAENNKSFFSFLLILFFYAFPNLKFPDDSEELAKQRAVFAAFYDFLNAHDLKIRRLLDVVDIALPNFFTHEQRILLEPVDYHNDVEAINRLMGATNSATFLLNATRSNVYFTYFDGDQNLLNNQFRNDPMLRETPSVDIFTLIPCATRFAGYNDFKVGKEVAGPQLNTLRSQFIKYILEYYSKFGSLAQISIDECVNYVLRHVFLRVTDVVSIPARYDSGSPPLFAAKLLNTNPVVNESTSENAGGGTIKITTEVRPPDPSSDSDLPTKKLIKLFIEYLTEDAMPPYPDELSLTQRQQNILGNLPTKYKSLFDEWLKFLWLELKTTATNALAINKKKEFLVSLGKNVIDQNFLTITQMTNEYIDLFSFFQQMQYLGDAISPGFNEKKLKREIVESKLSQSEKNSKIQIIEEKERLNQIYTTSTKSNQEQILIGAGDNYMSLCRKHYIECEAV